MSQPTNQPDDDQPPLSMSMFASEADYREALAAQNKVGSQQVREERISWLLKEEDDKREFYREQVFDTALEEHRKACPTWIAGSVQGVEVLGEPGSITLRWLCSCCNSQVEYTEPPQDDEPDEDYNA